MPHTTEHEVDDEFGGWDAQEPRSNSMGLLALLADTSKGLFICFFGLIR